MSEFMQVSTTKEAFVLIDNGYSESFWIPADSYTPGTIDKEEYITGAADGWFVRLSAPGYLDATEWMGPYKTEEAAVYAWYEEYDSIEMSWSEFVDKYELIDELKRKGGSLSRQHHNGNDEGSAVYFLPIQTYQE